MSNSSDADYKKIFSHPAMVQDIITGFAPGPWLADLDFATLEPFKSSFVAEFDQADARHSDLIWRVRSKGTWLYVYLLFEFQSSINQYMAIRMLVYVGLLYQELIKNAEFDSAGKLPFVLPIVLYNGTPRWSAPLATQDVISPPPAGFEHHIPQLHYFLIDEGSYDAAYLTDLDNLAAAIFLIETQTSLEGLHKALAKVLKWHDTTRYEPLFAAIAQLATRVLRKKLPADIPLPSSIYELKGVVSMLVENVEKMILEGESRGLKVGEERGLKAGEQRGEKKGSAMVLQAMLVRRFGPTPPWVDSKIDGATSTELAQWCVRLLDVSSIEELFQSNR